MLQATYDVRFIVNPQLFTVAKSSQTILLKSFKQKNIWEMLIRTLQKVILEVVRKFIIKSKVIIKSIKDADGNF